MNRLQLLSRATALLALTPILLPGAPRLIAPEKLTVGRNLQTFASIRLSAPAPAGGLQVTITSDDPSRLQLSAAPDEPAKNSISLRINHQYVETPDFFVHSVGEAGPASFTATAEGYEKAPGKVEVGKSGFVVSGPYKTSTFKVTTRTPARLAIYPVLVSEDGKPVARQPVAGGKPIEVLLTSSKADIGTVEPSKVVFNGGMLVAEAEFHPTRAGETAIVAKVPSSFVHLADSSTVNAIVEPPGIAISGDLHIGKDLQAQGLVLLGEAAPKGGLDVQLKSGDAKSLVLSPALDKLGSESITLHIPAGEMRATYYIQALGDKGTVNYSATATGYRDRSAPVYLAPSGIMVVYWLYGPPDEAEVIRASGVQDPRPFTKSLSDKKPSYVTLWPVFLDPQTRRGADRTAQRLRPGITAEVELRNSNPNVAEVVSKIVLRDAAEFALAEFKPRAVGETVISVSVPPGFTQPSNGATVTATVRE